jgi:hypothetical protein
VRLTLEHLVFTTNLEEAAPISTPLSRGPIVGAFFRRREGGASRLGQLLHCAAPRSGPHAVAPSSSAAHPRRRSRSWCRPSAARRMAPFRCGDLRVRSGVPRWSFGAAFGGDELLRSMRRRQELAAEIEPRHVAQGRPRYRGPRFRCRSLGISRGYVQKLILASGPAMRRAQGVVSRRIAGLLGMTL